MLDAALFGVKVTVPAPASTVPVKVFPLELIAILLAPLVDNDFPVPTVTVPVPCVVSERVPPALTEPLLTLMEPLFAVVDIVTAPLEATPAAAIEIELLLLRISAVDAVELKAESAPVFEISIAPPAFALKEVDAAVARGVTPELCPMKSLSELRTNVADVIVPVPEMEPAPLAPVACSVALEAPLKVILPLPRLIDLPVKLIVLAAPVIVPVEIAPPTVIVSDLPPIERVPLLVNVELIEPVEPSIVRFVLGLKAFAAMAPVPRAEPTITVDAVIWPSVPGATA